MFTRLCRQVASTRSSPVLVASQRTTGSLFNITQRSFAKEAAPASDDFNSDLFDLAQTLLVQFLKMTSYCRYNKHIVLIYIDTGPGYTPEGKAKLEEQKQNLYKFIHEALGNEEEAKRVFHYLKHRSNPSQRIYDVERFRRLVLHPHNFAQVPETRISQEQKKKLLAHAFETVNSKWKVDYRHLSDVKLSAPTLESIKAKERKRERRRARLEFEEKVKQEKEEKVRDMAKKLVINQQL